jgi:2-dehydropantoate 2-reductase
MRICILGTGGLGSVLGGYLAKAGVDVTLIGRPAHMQAIAQRGLRISGIRGEFLIRDRLTPLTHPREAEGTFDYLILLVKGKDNQQALQDAATLTRRVSAALSLQNGVGKNDILEQWIGADKVIGASTIEGGTLVEPGYVRNTLTTPTTVYFGERDGSDSGRVQELTAAFNHAGLGAQAVPNITQVEWEKLLQIATASGWSVTTLASVPRLTFADGVAVREGAEHYVQLASELLTIYKALGYTPQDFYAPLSRFRHLDGWSFAEAVEQVMEMGRRLQAQGMTGRTSMHEDVLRGRKTEVDFILKPFVEKAEALGIASPTVKAVYRISKTVDHYLAA